MKKMTHIGMVVGMAYNRGIKREIKLRETKMYYISEYGTKYSKDDGNITGERFPTFYLDISTIKELKWDVQIVKVWIDIYQR